MATSLYRKYRPAGFDSVIGQEHIVTTLTNQIRTGRVGHAYLFTGSRGTGKTTCAKIFARAINCLSPVSGSPCGKCEVCKALKADNNLDISEIDAASNNGVEDAREIRERVKYPPVSGKYKVYIIDEVHMLTGSAFNALLKTIEEPPSHAVFILATTEAHKLPATILSRCMRFDFRLVPSDKITALIKDIYDREGKKYEDKAIELIATLGEGSVRDALSIADMCMNLNDGVLTLSDAVSALAITDRSNLQALFKAVADGDIGLSLVKIDEQAKSGKSMSLVAKELASYARDLLLIKTGSSTLVVDTDENIAALTREQENYSVDLLVSLVQIFAAVDTELRYSISPKIALESAAIKACRLTGIDFNGIEERLNRLERRLDSFNTPLSGGNTGEISIPNAPDFNGYSSGRNNGNITPDLPQNYDQNYVQNGQNTSQSNAAKPKDALSVWGRITTYLRTNEAVSFFALAGNHHDVEIADGQLIIWANSDNYLQMSEEIFIDAVKRALKADGTALDVIVDKRKLKVDMDSEIDKIKKLIGNAPVNIKK